MNGARVPVTVIDQLVRELDSAEVQERKAHPLKRRTYQNTGPHHFWHYDGQDVSSYDMGFWHMAPHTVQVDYQLAICGTFQEFTKQIAACYLEAAEE